MIKVLVVGKRRCLVRMTENTVNAFHLAGCHTECFAINGQTRAHGLYIKLRGRTLGSRTAAIAEGLEKKVAAFKPDLLVFVLGAWMDALPFQAAAAAYPQAVRAAWVQDLFSSEQAAFAPYMHHLFCTDTYFMQLAEKHGITVPSSFLPLAMDPARFAPMNLPRNDKMVYVAKSSPGRAEFVRQIQRPLALYGDKWKHLKGTQHEIHPRTVSLEQLPAIYASSLAVLNIKNELNVVRGVNQRSFEPYGCKTPVINDDVADLERCFEPGREILVYRSIEELNTHYDRLATDRKYAEQIGEAGYKRVIAEHTYRHRALAMLRQLGLE